MELATILESPKKRKRPKIKGCHECSRRRIDCDRGVPQCHKCISKGLQCSGLGVRYRFSNGSQSQRKSSHQQDLIPSKELDPHPPSSSSSSCASFQTWSQVEAQHIKHVHEYTLNSNDNKPPEPHNSTKYVYIPRSIDHINPATRSLLSYFSTHIAPMMAVIDQRFNGYRDLILPLAENESLVQKAVLAASTQHLALKTGGLLKPQTKLYGEVLRGLITRSQSTTTAMTQDEVSLVSIILLLVCEMITGGRNFNLVYGALKNFMSVGQDNFHFENSEMGLFLKIQTYRFQLFAESLLSEADGSRFVSIQLEKCLEFLRFCHSFHPEHEDMLIHLEDMVQQACEIYVRRVVDNPPPSSTIPMVEKFKQSAEKVDREHIGQQILVWPYFVVAAESSDPGHRKFFLERIQRHHQLTGFENCMKALRQLKRIWNMQQSTRWTTLLGGPAQVLIM